MKSIKKQDRKSFICLFVGMTVLLFASVLLVNVNPTYASSSQAGDIDLIDGDKAQTGTGLGAATPVEIVGALIGAFLGILGLIALIIIIHSGWVWMIAGGNKEKITQAQEKIKAATIGLAIIMASYGIALWIFSALEESTGYGGKEPTPSSFNYPGIIYQDENYKT